MSHKPGSIGIRREDKNDWERRVPVTPEQVSRLVEEEGVRVAVQPSSLRAFADKDYAAVGAEVREDLGDCNLVLGVKEMPDGFFRQGGRYMFFSHVIKGQAYNMPMLTRMMALGCTLLDYEKIEDDEGRRLVFFGRFAGIAGAVNTLHALGRRLEHERIRTPLFEVKQALGYGRVDVAKRGLADVGAAIRKDGLPGGLGPLVVGVAGYGHVAQGVLEMLDALGAERIEPEELPGLGADGRTCYCTVFREEHTVAPRAGGEFDLQDYYRHPEKYQSVFERHLPYLTALVNCIYWDKRYPRLVTKRWLGEAFAGAKPRLRVIGDISCDVGGSVEATLKVTDSGSPFFVYDPARDEARDGIVGDGVVVMAVDNLPCELPFGSSREFGIALMPFLPRLARADFSRPLERLELPAEMRRALILHHGELTPEFEYVRQYLDSERRQRR